MHTVDWSREGILRSTIGALETNYILFSSLRSNDDIWLSPE
jgi:hypothetical protein